MGPASRFPLAVEAKTEMKKWIWECGTDKQQAEGLLRVKESKQGGQACRNPPQRPSQGWTEAGPWAKWLQKVLWSSWA